MGRRPMTGRGARMRLATVAACSVLIAAGGVLAGTPASASACADPVATTGTVTGLTGVVDLLGCSSDPSGGATAASSPTGPAPDSPTVGPTAAPLDPTAPDPTTTVPESAGVVARLAALSIGRSSSAVYPVRDGYLDTVRFRVWGADALGGRVPLTGVAELTRSGAIAETWHLDDTHDVITWDGRVHGTIRAGLYTLAVTASSPDGSSARAVTRVRVIGQRLVHQSLVVRSDVGARSVTAELPRQLLRAYATGRVYCRVRTDAVVTGPAELVFSQDGVTRSVTLRNGVHTTGPLPVPQGFDHVTITHAWRKGDAHLRSLRAIWTYSVLE